MEPLRELIERLRVGLTRPRLIMLLLALGLIVAGTAWLYTAIRLNRVGSVGNPSQDDAMRLWFSGDEGDRDALITRFQGVACEGAPFVLPTEGFIGLLYGDPRGPYSTSAPHQGIDIFSSGAPGQTPVYAAYDGYLARETFWTSALILGVPSDPLYPDRQIWLYYTHMANVDGALSFIDSLYPPGTRNQFVEQGAFLGYTGNYSGTARSIATHLHFSIVLSNPDGSYRNELDFDNTVDPSRYLGISVNYGCAPVAPGCMPDPTCENAVLGDGGA